MSEEITTNNSELSLDSVKNYLSANKDNEDVKEYIGTFQGAPDKEAFESWIQENDEGKNFVSKLTDKRVSQAISTYKDNHFEAAVKNRVEEVVRERYPDETEDQKRLRDLELKFKAKEREAQRQKNNNLALKLAQQKNMGNLRTISHLVKDDDTEDDIATKLRDLEEDLSFIAKESVNKIVAQKKRVDSSGDEDHIFSREEIANMSPEQYAKHRDTILNQLSKKKK